MKNPISVSTGLVYKFHNSQSDRIQRMRELNLQGMELCISDANEVLSFNPSPEIVSYLRSLKRLTIHAPWINIKYNDNAFCRMVLKKIELLCELLGVENVIIHSSWTEDYTLFKEYKFHVLLENEDYKFGEMGFPNRIESILNANPDIGFNFDFAHALTL